METNERDELRAGDPPYVTSEHQERMLARTIDGIESIGLENGTVVCWADEDAIALSIEVFADSIEELADWLEGFSAELRKAIDWRFDQNEYHH
jgi:hypothetical protein